MRRPDSYDAAMWGTPASKRRETPTLRRRETRTLRRRETPVLLRWLTPALRQRETPTLRRPAFTDPRRIVATVIVSLRATTVALAAEPPATPATDLRDP